MGMGFRTGFKTFLPKVAFVACAIVCGSVQAQVLGSSPAPLYKEISCVDIMHTNHGLGFYTLNLTAAAGSTGQPIYEALLGASAEDNVSSSKTVAAFAGLEEIKSGSSLIYLGSGLRVEITATPYAEGSFLASVTLSAGPYRFVNETYACRFD